MNFGALLAEAQQAAEQLNATLIDMRWAKPLDETLIAALACSHQRLVTVEENALAGGAGSGVAEFLAGAGISCEVRHIAIADQWNDHASQQQKSRGCGLKLRCYCCCGHTDDD